MTQIRLRKDRHSVPPVRRYDIGGALARAVPAITLPYIAVQKAEPFRLDDLMAKEKAVDTEKINKTIGELDKTWSDRMKDLDVLPAYQELANVKRREFFSGLYNKVLDDPGYLNNSANFIKTLDQSRQLVDSPEFSTMKQNTKDLRSWYERKVKANLQDSQHRDVNGELTGMTVQQYYDMMNGTSGEAQRKYLNITPERGAGSIQLDTWDGTEQNLNDELDKLSGMVKADRVQSSQGRYRLAPELASQFGARYSQVEDYLNSSSHESNATGLQRLASYYASDWERKLSKPAAQALENKLVDQFQDSMFAHEIKTTDGRVFGKQEASVANVERLAKQGKLENAEQVLQQLRAERRNYIHKSGVEQVAARLMTGRFDDRSSESKVTLHTVDVGGVDAAAKKAGKEGDGKQSYESAARANNTDNKVVDVADAQNPTKTHSLMLIQPTDDVWKKRHEMYDGKPLSSFESMWLTPQSAPNSGDWFGKLKGKDKMRVLSYNGDAKVPEATGANTLRLKQTADALTKRYQDLAFNTLTNAATPEQINKAKADMDQARIAVGTAMDQERTRLRHRVSVIMPLEVLQANNETFTWTDRDGRQHRPYEPMIGNYFNTKSIDMKAGEQGNPYQFRIPDENEISPEQLKKFGYQDYVPQKLVVVDMMMEAADHQVLNDGSGKAIQNEIGDLRSSRFQQGAIKNVNKATGLSYDID